MTSKDYHKIITAIYRQYNPDKVSEVASLLDKYKGQEEALLQSIISKYKVSVNDIWQLTNERKKETPSTEPVYETDAYAPISKSKTKLWIGIGLAGLIVIAFAIWWNYFYREISSNENKTSISSDSVSVRENINSETGIKETKYPSINLDDLIALRLHPDDVNTLKAKGYKLLTSTDEEQVYIGSLNDTISVFKGDENSVTWSAGLNRQWLFKYLKEQASRRFEYDKDYSEAEIGDEPPIPVYSQSYSYFDDEGIEHTATIFYKDKQKIIPKSYSFYIGGSE